eukprot:m.116853 g.116853  ORF g.116853 m.116853 type:complete len:617 (+) comp16389_c1_seq4:427-2277(+)
MGAKKFLGQDYKQLKRKHNKTRPFTDPQFPPTARSLYVINPPPGIHRIVWKRASELAQDPHMFVDGADSRDVKQGSLGNCWFVAAAAALASQKKFLNHVIPPDNEFEDGSGVFHFRFWEFGEWVDVVVDDYLPTVGGKLLYVYSDAKNEFWPSLLEKAYAKLNGCYENLEAGNPAEAMVNFTSGVSETIALNGPMGAVGEPRKALFKLLQHNHRRQAMMSASIAVTRRSDMERKLACGLVIGHAYAVTDVMVIHKLPMIKLRNPWGSGEWLGAWSDKSTQWKALSRREKRKVGLTVADDGEFWMTLDDFCKRFTSLTICRLINLKFFRLSKVWFLASFFGRWHGPTAGGCANFGTFLNNPQYIVDHREGDLMVSLTQTDVRAMRYKGVRNRTIGFQLFKVAENREHRLSLMQPATASSEYINNREVFGRFKLETGRYVLIPSTFEPKQETGFMLRVFTDFPTNMKRLRTTVPKMSIWNKCGFTTYPRAVILITLVSATGLKKQNFIGGANPYVQITCESKKASTPVVYSTLEPTWECSLIFYVKSPRTAVATVRLWNWNVIRDQYMGEVKVKVSNFLTAERANGTYKITKPLVDKEGKPAKGTLVFKVVANSSLRI